MCFRYVRRHGVRLQPAAFRAVRRAGDEGGGDSEEVTKTSGSETPRACRSRLLGLAHRDLFSGCVVAGVEVDVRVPRAVGMPAL